MTFQLSSSDRFSTQQSSGRREAKLHWRGMDVDLLVDRYLLDRRYKEMLAEEEESAGELRQSIRRPLAEELDHEETPGWAGRLIRSLFGFVAPRDI